MGLEELLNFYRFVRIIDSGRHQLTAVVSNGQVVAVEGTFRGRVKDGRLVSQEFAEFFSVSEGRTIARSTYFAAPAI